METKQAQPLSTESKKKDIQSATWRMEGGWEAEWYTVRTEGLSATAARWLGRASPNGTPPMFGENWPEVAVWKCRARKAKSGQG